MKKLMKTNKKTDKKRRLTREEKRSWSKGL